MSGQAEARPTLLRRSLAHALPHAVLLAALALYSLAVEERTLFVRATQLLSEAPLVVYLFSALAAPLRPGFLRWVAAGLPIVGLYLVHDEFVVRWGDVPNLGDFGLLSDLFVVLSPWAQALLVLALSFPLLLWLSRFDPRVLRERPRALVWLVPALCATLLVHVAPSASYAALDALTEDLTFSDRRGSELWGRLYGALLRRARRGKFEAGLQQAPSLERAGLALGPDLLARLDGRNVHLVVLESFVDLRRLRKVRFSEPPFDPELAAWVDASIGTSISPVFGGETARAEFEVLCGVPSLGLFGVEFLAFSGAETHCLPGILHRAGYQTVLTFPHGPVFFNTRRAYPGLGFRRLIYGDRFVAPGQEAVAMGEQDYLFDGDLFPQNLHTLQDLLARKRPFLNYVMTIYGHWPFDIDRTRHPLTIEPSVADADLRAIASQMRQRTEALHAYLRELVRLDPTGLVVLVADHLPPLPGGKADYLRYGYEDRAGVPGDASDVLPYENFLLVLVDGKPLRLPRMRHFDLSHWLLDQLSAGAYCRSKPCDFGVLPVDHAAYLARYQAILSLAAGEPRPSERPP